MRLGLNMLHLVPGETGGSELYARRLVPALMQARPELEVTIFAAREGAPSLAAEPWAGGLEVVEIPVHARSRPRRVLAEQTLLPRAVRRARIDLLHNLFTTAPALPGTTQVSTIQDLIYKRFPDAHRGILTRGMALLVPLAVRRSERLLTYSESSKRDIVDFLGVDPDADRRDAARPRAASRAARHRCPRRSCAARLDLGDRPIVLSVSAKRAAQEHRAADRRGRAAARSGAGGAGLPHRLRGRPRGARPRERRRRPCPLPRLGGRRDARRALRRRALLRVPVARRGLRAAGARGDAARHAGGVLERDVDPRGRRRRGALLRPDRHCRRWPQRSASCWPTRPCARAWSRRDASARPASPGSAAPGTRSRATTARSRRPESPRAAWPGPKRSSSSPQAGTGRVTASESARASPSASS